MEEQQAGQSGGGRPWRLVLLLASLVALPPVAGGVLYWLDAIHLVVPGLEGCRFVREREPQIGCYASRIRGVVEEDGLDTALQRVDDVALEQPTLAADCHLAWHRIGEPHGRRDARADRKPRRIEAQSVCQEGYSHGYTIGYLDAARLTSAQVQDLLIADCSDSTDTRDVMNCVHSFGHVFARKAGRSEATATCMGVRYAQLLQGGRPALAASYRFQCLYGMYMEIGLIDLKRKSRDEDNCHDAPGGREPKRACYAYISARVGAMRGGLEPGARACSRIAPQGAMRNACVTTFAQALPDRRACSYFATREDRALCERNVGGERIA